MSLGVFFFLSTKTFLLNFQFTLRVRILENRLVVGGGKGYSALTNLNKLIFKFSIDALSIHFVSNFLAFNTR